MSFKKIDKRIVKNLFFLTSSQSINLLIPLIIVPYIVKNVGVNNYGHIAVEQSLGTYIYILVDYGFNITSVRTLSCIGNNNINLVNQTVSNVLFTKVPLTIISIFLYYVFSIVFIGGSESGLINFSLLLILGQATSPIWLIQGIGKVGYILIINVISKLFALGLILLLVNSSKDYIYVNFSLGLSSFIVNILFLTFIFRYLKIKLNFTNIKENIKKELLGGLETFKSNTAINIYSNSGILILKAIGLDDISIGQFGVFEKIMQLIKVPISMYLQSTNTFFFEKAKNVNSNVFFEKFMKYPFYSFFLILLLLSGLYYVNSDYIIRYMFGTDFYKYKWLDRTYNLVITLPIFVYVFNVIHYQLLIIYNKDKVISSILGKMAFWGVIILSFFAYYWEVQGIIWGIIITEIIVGILITKAFYKDIK